MEKDDLTPPTRPLDLLILGASRGIGACAAEAALVRGHAVRAFARSPETLRLEDPRITRYAGDARSPDALRPAVSGADAVIYAIGTPGAARGPLGSRVTLHSEATRALIDVMNEAGVPRLVAVTGYGAGESRLSMSLLERTAHRALLGRPYADKDRQEALIRGSGLDWTIVRPTILRDSPARGRYQVLRSSAEWHNGLIARADVADFLVRRAEDREYLREAPVLAW